MSLEFNSTMKDVRSCKIFREDIDVSQVHEPLHAEVRPEQQESGASRGFLWKEYSFDEQGRETGLTVYFEDGRIQHSLRRGFDQLGRPVNIEESGEDCPNPVTTLVQYVDEEKLVSRVQYFDKEVNEKELTWHDGEGRPLRTELKDWEDVLQSSTERAYDEKGNMVLFVQKTGTGEELLRIEYRYDVEGNLVEEREIRDGETLQRTFAYEGKKPVLELWTEEENAFVLKREYDLFGREVRNMKYIGSAGDRVTRALFDDSGNVVERDSENEILALTMTTTTYDADGRVLEEVRNIAEQGVIIKNRNHFDAAGRLQETLHLNSSKGRYSSGGESYILRYEYK